MSRSKTGERTSSGGVRMRPGIERRVATFFFVKMAASAMAARTFLYRATLLWRSVLNQMEGYRKGKVILEDVIKLQAVFASL